MAEDAWSEEELKASVDAYALMLRADAEGRKVNKAQIYRDLEAQFGRKNKAFERRMMNISHVVVSLGGKHVKGLLPAPNIGPTVRPVLEKLVRQSQILNAMHDIHPPTTEASNPVDMDRKVSMLLDNWGQSDARILPPSGLKSPTKRDGNSTVYNRSPEVKAWVLQEADGSCECCEKPAPFVKDDGTAYLEVHHVVTLAQGGPDTVSNTVAVCPDCHRALHFAADRDVRVEKLYMNIDRLQKN
ncbi:HNH endonuclease [Halioglobus maricola]|uniref:HNH endonuclease n=1 Tax=Halioglobus maricola TaxID=2601894 RepID=A0A5P9NJE5_9GAMM|nr:HNH endonuclease [Halioglobus maricola]QFU75344.1 HNH endonuclease [Halioglobus maricola]